MNTKTIPGIFKVEYIELKDLILYPRQKLTPGSSTTALGSFQRIPLVRQASLSYSDEKTASGTLYNTTLSGTLLDDPALDEAKRARLIELPHAFRATDYYGNKYLIGCENEPHPEISFTPAIDNLPSGIRAIEFQITWKSTLPPIELVIL